MSTKRPVQTASGGTPAPPVEATVIRELRIERFRGIASLKWKPAEGLNVVLGGGDVGKTTILEAIALLFSPTTPATLSDTDYHSRDIVAEFSIEADVSLPVSSGIDHQVKPSWPWAWDGEQAVAPALDNESTSTHPTVYRLRVRGTCDLELFYEVVQPDGTADSLSVTLRRSIGLVRLGGDDRNDRDLRLVQGSALDRLLGDKNLRSKMTNELAKAQVHSQLSETAKNALEALDNAFADQKLPHGLNLAITGSPGVSIASMIGLTAQSAGVQLPLASWGSGTRRLAALTISEENHGEAPITVVDEIERGLEPYRQRSLIQRLQADRCQSFVTTHSPTIVSAADTAAFWYVDQRGNIGSLDAKKIAQHRASDPEAFLSLLTIVGEGITEVGFTSALLTRALGSPLLKYGIHLTDGGGHEKTLDLLEALSEGGLQFGCFADDEGGKHPTRWSAVANAQGHLVFRWKTGCTEANIIGAVPQDKLHALVIDPTGETTGMRLRSLAARLNIGEKDFASVSAAAGDRLRELIIEAATGTIPTDKMEQAKEYKRHDRLWFKSFSGGQELEGKVFSLALWPSVGDTLLPFCNAVRKAVGLPEIDNLP